MKNLEPREGFLNRHTTELPREKCLIRAAIMEVYGESILLCEWNPFDKSQWPENNMPAEGYLGTARIVEGEYKGVGFNVWEQNNSEFVYFMPV